MDPADTPRIGMGWQDHSYLLRPPQPSVYRVRDERQVIIYVGMTVQWIEERFSAYRVRPRRGRGASWWDLAASVEVLPVPGHQVRQVEALEIHRWHPRFNSQCYHCGEERTAPTTAEAYWYRVWCRLRREQWDRTHEPWRQDLSVFIAEITALLGERPGRRNFRLTDPDGRWEPGNVSWGKAGPYRQPGPYSRLDDAPDN